MKNNVLFLDIDGVLNGHDFDVAAQSTRIQYRCVRQLNRIIKATECKIVLCSAWRYMLLKRPRHKPAMTLTGQRVPCFTLPRIRSASSLAWSSHHGRMALLRKSPLLRNWAG